ncbi:MAG: hypothetical protein HC876_22550 [Chloroflexaceae bacterium]|nr:hypothetical protein [Chloroflexaceae bacterium]
MASNKQRLKGLIDSDTSGAAPSGTGSDLTHAQPAVPLRRGLGYHLGAPAAEDDLDFSLLGGSLPEALQNLARLYVGARRRSGEELLKAARWLSEARAMAKVGEWQVFLEATSTSHDTATRLINIHRLAMENPQFAESVANNWIGHSAAALLAQPSTPSDVIDDILSADISPSVADVRGAIRVGKHGGGHSTQFAEVQESTQFAESTHEPEVVQLSFFDQQERSLIPVLTSKIELVLRGNTHLQPEEWRLIEPLAEALRTLLDQSVGGKA